MLEENMIEVWKMLKYRVRLYIGKLFQLTPSPRILLLVLQMLGRRAKYRVRAELLHRAGGELRGHDGSYGDGAADLLSPGVDLWPAPRRCMTSPFVAGIWSPGSP